jgi:hypothetical protein
MSALILRRLLPGLHERVVELGSQVTETLEHVLPSRLEHPDLS